TALKGDTDSEAVLTDAIVNENLSVDALRLDAMRTLTAYVDANADAPTAMLEELAKLAVSFDPARAFATRQKLHARGQRGPSYVGAVVRRGSKADVVAAAKAALQTGAVEDADDVVHVVRAVGNAGAHDEALAFGALAVGEPP